MIIRVVGIGPSGSRWLTAEAKEAVQWANLIIGAERQLEAVAELIDSSQKTYIYESVHKDMKDYIDAFLEAEIAENGGHHRHKGKMGMGIVVLASGDPSLYGVANYLIGRYGKDMVTVTAGISSVQYLFAKVGQNMNDLYLTSCHGREVNFDRIFGLPKAALLTDEQSGPFEIAAEALKRGLNPLMIVGESLGYDNETILQAKASDIEKRAYGLNVVIVINEEQQ